LNLKKLVSLSDDQKKVLRIRKSLIKKKQYLASRRLMEIFSINEISEFFNISSIENKNIFYSISHTKKFAILSFGNEMNGVDIESHRSKIINIKSKFINKKENFAIHTNDIKVLTRLWTSKEAIFKCMLTKELSLKNDIEIKKFNNESKVGFANVYLKDKKVKVNLHFINFNNYELTLAHI
tara:strand:+ start:322 stop:864 length:543 start_codon:yes stop_codon:yes gene_type:complete